jgi:hypothetical protein
MLYFPLHFMGTPDQPSFRPSYLSIAEIQQMYQQRNRPLNADTILATLKPLAGTSFLRHATEVLQLKQPGEPLQADDFFLIFYGALDDTTQCRDPQMRNAAEATLSRLAGFRVPENMIHLMRWMEQDELMAQEMRSDYLYHDPKHKQLAGIHVARQLRFYKAETPLQTLLVSQLQYMDTEGFHLFTQLAEGALPHTSFTDKKRSPLPFLDPGARPY